MTKASRNVKVVAFIMLLAGCCLTGIGLYGVSGVYVGGNLAISPVLVTVKNQLGEPVVGAEFTVYMTFSGGKTGSQTVYTDEMGLASVYPNPLASSVKSWTVKASGYVDASGSGSPPTVITLTVGSTPTASPTKVPIPSPTPDPAKTPSPTPYYPSYEPSNPEIEGDLMLPLTELFGGLALAVCGLFIAVKK